MHNNHIGIIIVTDNYFIDNVIASISNDKSKTKNFKTFHYNIKFKHINVLYN